MLSKIRLGSRINLVIVILLLIIFSSLGVVFFQYQRSEILSQLDERMNTELNDLSDILKLQNIERQKSVSISLNLAKALFIKTDSITQNDSLSLDYLAINQITKEQYRIRVPYWHHDNNILQRNYEFVDMIKKDTDVTATIFQKIDQGYLRISTNVPTNSGKRAVGTFIPNSSPIIQTIEYGNDYVNRAYVVSDWYTAAYTPLYVDGEISGILYVGIKELDLKSLKSVFDKRTYFETGYPFIVSSEGYIQVHPKGYNKIDIQGTELFAKIKKAYSNRQYKIEYKWPENNEGKEKIAYIKYLQSSQGFICVSVYTDELYSELNLLRVILLAGIIFSIIIFVAVFMSIFGRITKFITLLVTNMNEMATGKIVVSIEHSRQDEIGSIANSLNTLIKTWNEKIAFAKSIGNGNFGAKLKLLSKDDVLGNVLIEMQKSLQSAETEQQKRSLEDYRRNWTSDGLAKFAEILRNKNTDLQHFGEELTVQIVKYLGIEIAAFYLVNDTDSNDIFIEPVSLYAYNRQRQVDTRIELNEGLIGRVVSERKYIYMTELPHDYIKITSGLGGEQPNSLLVLPFIYNKQILGVLELASFKTFQPFEIEFTNKICDSIASSINSVKINTHTQELLYKSKHQAEALAAQEEELRQNIEEMQTTQEESYRREKVLNSSVSELRKLKSEDELKDIQQTKQTVELQLQHKKVLNELKIKENTSRSIIENSLDGVIIINETGIISFFNNSATKIWGYTAEEVLGKNVSMLMPSNVAIKHNSFISNYLRTNKAKIIGIGREVLALRKNGSQTYIFLSIIETKIAGNTNFTAFVRDLTQDKEIQDEQVSLTENIMAKELEYRSRIDNLEAILRSNNIPIPDNKQYSLINWLPEYNLNIEIIDNQHHNWIKLINNLHDAFKLGRAMKQLESIFDELHDYTGFHFGTEEKFMQNFDYDDYENHHDSHTKFFEQLEKFRNEYEKGKPQVAYDLMQFLRKWVHIHITECDKKYVECFKNNNV